MNDEFTARQAAISLRLAGRSVKRLFSALGRCEAWFHERWHRYLEDGPEGLYDLTRPNHQVSKRIPPELERAILSVSRRLQAHASPATRYSLVGTTAILAEFKALSTPQGMVKRGFTSVARAQQPARRTVERIEERATMDCLGNRSRGEEEKCTEAIEPRRHFPDASADPTDARNSQDLRRRNRHRAPSRTVVLSDGHRSRTGRFFLIAPMVRLEGERRTLPAVGPARDSSGEARARA